MLLSSSSSSCSFLPPSSQPSPHLHIAMLQICYSPFVSFYGPWPFISSWLIMSFMCYIFVLFHLRISNLVLFYGGPGEGFFIWVLFVVAEGSDNQDNYNLLWASLYSLLVVVSGSWGKKGRRLWPWRRQVVVVVVGERQLVPNTASHSVEGSSGLSQPHCWLTSFLCLTREGWGGCYNWSRYETMKSIFRFVFSKQVSKKHKPNDTKK